MIKFIAGSSENAFSTENSFLMTSFMLFPPLFEARAVHARETERPSFQLREARTDSPVTAAGSCQEVLADSVLLPASCAIP